MLLLIIMVALALMAIIPPIVVFYQGLKALRVVSYNDNRKLNALYQIFCGLPTVLLLVLFILVFIGRKLELFIDQPEVYSGLLIVGLATDAIVIGLLLIKGAVSWCREKDDVNCYREGRRDIFYALYHLGVFLLFFLLIKLCLSTSEFQQVIALMI